jgi:hypothetical protein
MGEVVPLLARERFGGAVDVAFHPRVDDVFDAVMIGSADENISHKIRRGG